jgi:antitoxin HigA-1
MIRGFRSKALRAYFERRDTRGLSVQNVARVGRILRALDVATRPEQVNLPGYFLHALRGERRRSVRGYGQLANHFRLARQRCDWRGFGGLSLMVKRSTAKGLPAMHPGELLREDVIPALGRPRSEIARLLGISRQMLHAILTERAPVTPEMALRLGKLCGNGPELWINLQTRYDLDRLAREKRALIDAIPTLAAE